MVSFIKKVILLITTFFILTQNIGFAQTRTDSIKQLIERSIESEKPQLLHSLCINYLLKSSDSCIKYGLENIKLSQRLNDKRSEAKANEIIGYAYFRTGDYNKSLYHYKRTRELFAETSDYLGLAIVSNYIGDVYKNTSDFKKAISNYIIAEKICDSLVHNDSIQNTVIQIYSILYTNLGLLYFNLDSLQKPLKYFNKALGFATEINDSTRIAASYSNIGMIYKNQNNHKQALENYFKSLSISQKIGNQDYERSIFNNIANIYSKTGLSDSALIYYFKAYNLALAAKAKYGLSLILRNIADNYLNQHKYDSALVVANKALEYSKTINSLQEEYSNLELVSTIYKSIGNYEKAYEYYIMYSVIYDSVNNAKTMAEVADIRTKYETEKKEKENKLLIKDIEFEKGKSYYLLLLTMLLFLMGVISLILFYFIRKNTLTRRKLARSEASRLEAELETQKRELTLGALSVSRNLEFINSLINELQELTNHVNEEGLQSLNNVVKKLSAQQSDNSWKEFEKRFSEIHSNFYSNLLKQYPNLTQSEVKLSAFLKLGMNTKEICAITFQSVRAVEASRLRLRKKLDLTNGENLSIFLQKY